MSEYYYVNNTFINIYVSNINSGSIYFVNNIIE